MSEFENIYRCCKKLRRIPDQIDMANHIESLSQICERDAKAVTVKLAIAVEALRYVETGNYVDDQIATVALDKIS